MIIKQTVQVGNPTIRKHSKPVKNVMSNATQKLIVDLRDSMRYHSLVGMAGPQIGVNQRVFVTEITKTKFRKPDQLDKLRVFINPKITSWSKQMAWGFEGCGSVAESGIFAKIKRHAKVTVSAFNEHGEKFNLTAVGLLAKVIQHEMDHLDGKVFLDKLKKPLTLRSRSEHIKIMKASL